MKRFILAATAAVTLATAPAAGLLPMVASVVHADDWCATDPMIKVVTPTSTTNLFLTISALGSQHMPALAQEQHTVVTAPIAGSSSSLATVTVLVPNDALASGFPTRAVVSDQPNGQGNVLASVQGVSGQVMTLTFTVSGN